MKTTYQIIRRVVNQHLQFPDSVPEVLQRVYAARNINAVDEVDYALRNLQPATMLNIQQAVDLLFAALREDKKILIIGDYDVDGATSTTLAIRALKAMGCKRVDYLLPNRFEYGYGLSTEIVEVAKNSEPNLIITVDNGISSIEGVEAAKALGIDVLITDHHLPGEQLPAADVIVNPNLSNDPFPSKSLAGVGVVFYILMALRTRLRDEGWFKQSGLSEPNLAQYLDLVALGTVADVVPLDYNNRILVDQGLKRIKAGKCIPGISALLKIGRREQSDISSSDLGFVLGPRLNAAGRLDDMSVGVECLLTDDMNEALGYAATLDEINKERRAIEKTMQDDAFSVLKSTLDNIDLADLPAGLCFYNESWHQGVVGIVASRIKDKTHRPVIVFAPATDQALSCDHHDIKGSARSVTGFHIRDALDAIATRHPKMISKFGGHAMAAGLSLSSEYLEDFKRAFAEEAQKQLGDDVGRAVLYTDGDLGPDQASLDLAECLKSAGPWGQTFPEPLFDGEFEIQSHQIVGGAHLKLQLVMKAGGQLINAIAFNNVGESISDGTHSIKAAYHLTVNEFNGRRTPQLDIRYFEALPG